MPDYEHRFPEAFLETGKDDDRSYNSFRTTRLSDGRLEIAVERWCIIEIGFWLRVEPGEVLKVKIGLVRCSVGLERTRTWEKKTVTFILEKKEEEKAQYMEYSHSSGSPPGTIELKLSKVHYPES